MIQPLPKKEMKKYATLWRRFKNKTFTHQQAQELLKEKDRHRVTVYFNHLRYKGWLKDMRDDKDKRKRIYKLISPNSAISEL